MLKMNFSFSENVGDCSEKLKRIFKNCRVLSFENHGGSFNVIFDDGIYSWGEIISAARELAHCEWFTKSVTLWELSAAENGESFTEDLLLYCRKNGKGAFR